MTKGQAIEEFKEEVWPDILEAEQLQGGWADWDLRFAAWHSWMDELRDAGRITDEQYETWAVPAFCDPHR